MTPTRLALILLPLLVACSTPQSYDSVGAKVAGGLLLTYVDGEPDDGTTTVVSAPLLAYRGTEQKPGYERTSTYFLPLLFHHEATRREIRVERAWDTGCPPDDDGWWEAQEPGDKPRRRPMTSKEKARHGITPSRPRGGRSDPWTRSRRDGEEPKTKRSKTKRSKPKRSKARSSRRSPPRSEGNFAKRSRVQRELERQREREWKEERERAYVRPGSKPAPSDWQGRTLRLEEPGRVLPRKFPSRREELTFLWPLISMTSERPGRIAIDPDSGPAQVYEVGPDSTNVRFLPLFSHSREGKRTETILWPLLGCGWETTSKGSYLRLFYFLRFKVD